ncbi:MAG: RNase P subunit p30 family protein [Candidatus Pacearchaeota archaeon]
MKDINFLPLKDSIYLKKISNKSEISSKDSCEGYLIDTNEKESRRIIDFLKGKKKILAVLGRDNSFNRRAIETLKIDYLVSPEIGERKDTLKQKDSGLNHIIAKESAKKGIAIVIPLFEISKIDKEKKALRLSRIAQNIKICRRAKCEIKIANLSEDKKNLINEIGRRSLGLSLGMSTEQAKKATNF